MAGITLEWPNPKLSFDICHETNDLFRERISRIVNGFGNFSVGRATFISVIKNGVINAECPKKRHEAVQIILAHTVQEHHPRGWGRHKTSIDQITVKGEFSGPLDKNYSSRKKRSCPLGLHP